MKWYGFILLILAISGLYSVAAQDDNSNLTMQVACQPEVFLPDTSRLFGGENLPDYTGEQLIRFCITVRDVIGNIRTDPQLQNLQIFVNSTDGAVPILHPPYDPEGPGQFPYEIVLVLDSSGSMDGRATQMQRAAKEAVRNAALPNASYAVISFNTQPHTLQSFTQDNQLINAAIDQADPVADGDTCLYDAVDAAVKLNSLPSISNPRRVVILFTDGENNDRAGVCTINKPDDVFKNAIGRGVQVYAIGLQGTRGINKDSLDTLTVPTGGAAFAGGLDDLPTLFDSVLTQLNGLRILSVLVCGQGVVTLTAHANIENTPIVSQAVDVDLGNRGQCIAPTPLPDATPTLEPTPLPPLVPTVDFKIVQNDQAQDIANLTISFPGRTDIDFIQVNFRDSELQDALTAPEKCVGSEAAPDTFTCAIDVTALKSGKITLSIIPFDTTGSPLSDQPITRDYPKEDIQPQLQIGSDSGSLQVTVNFPVPASSAKLNVYSPTGALLPISTQFTGAGPYQLNIDNIDVDTVTVEAELTYGPNNIRKAVSQPYTLERAFGQKFALFLRTNGLLVAAVLALGTIGTVWVLRRQGNPKQNDEAWLRSPVPEVTRNYPKVSEAAPSSIASNEATKIYETKAAIGELEVIRMTSDPSREGSRIPLKVPFTIGRASNCQLVINDEFLSRAHVTISQKDAIVHIRDMGSANGTKVNGQPLTPHQDVMLKNGAEITLGDGVKLRFNQSQELITRIMKPPTSL